MTDPDVRPPRRQRYRGTHPRKLDEKYKELRGDPAAVARAAERGQTPAGQHRPIMVSEIVAALAPAPGQIVVDCTLGWGGHTEVLAHAVAPGGRVVALDLDKDELERTRVRLEGLAVSIHAMNFAGLPKVLTAEGLSGVHGLLADLGVSSMQLDRPERGFSLKHNGPLDMRMDRTRGAPASAWLKARNVDELTALLTDFGDEPDAERVAAAIVAAYASERPIVRTRDLVKVVLRAKGLDPDSKQVSAFKAHPAARTFQAIRMGVNRELENLAALLRVLPAALLPGAKAAIMSFHSGEERLIQAAFAKGVAEGTYVSADRDGRRAGPDEVAQNPRSRSARLFVATRAA
jgi:16S rRNA (cytosine1402-N4)-methyltransferase